MNTDTAPGRTGSPRLLSINNYNYRRGGAEVVYLEHNRLLRDAGFDVSCFAMQHPRNEPSKDDDLFVEEIEFGHDYGLKQKIINASRVIYSFEARRKIAGLIERVSPDIAHAHNVYHHISPAIFPELKRAGVPTVLTLHDLKIACPAYTMRVGGAVCERCKGGRIHNLVVNRCIKGSLPLSAMIFLETAVHRTLNIYDRNIDRFVVPSRFLIDKFVDWGWRRERFCHIPNFVDCDQLSYRSGPGDHFLYFGRLSHEKGLTDLIEAGAKSGQKLVIVGTGQQEAELKGLAARLEADVTFLGYRSGHELHDAVAAARAIVLPSTWYENAPISILESYALGRPVIGTRIGGIPEMIKDQETGLIVAPGAPDALAAALSNMAALPSSRVEQMGRSGRDWVETAFSKATYLTATLALYQELGITIEGTRHARQERVS